MIDWEECGKAIGHCWAMATVGLREPNDPGYGVLKWALKCRHCGATGEGWETGVCGDDAFHPTRVKQPEMIDGAS